MENTYARQSIEHTRNIHHHNHFLARTYVPTRIKQAQNKEEKSKQKMIERKMWLICVES